MKRFFFLSVFVVFASAILGVDASPADTTKKEVKVVPVVHFIHAGDLHFDSLHFIPLDTNLENVQVINPAIEKFYNYLSTISSASSPQIFSDTNFIFTDVGIHTFDLYLKKSEDIRYYKTNTRLSELKYHTASGSEQQISVMLTQNITPNWNAGIDFNRLGNPGYMKNSKSYLNNIDLYTWYHTKNNRYTIFASALWNTIKNEVNGGQRSDTVFNLTSQSNTDQAGFPIFLNDGMQQLHNHEFSLTQFFDVGSKSERKLNDSVSVFDFHPAVRIEHSVTFESTGLTYSDNSTDSSFYEHYYFRSATVDTLHYYNMMNKFSLRTTGNKKGTTIPHYLVGEVGLVNQWMQYAQQRIDSLGFGRDLIGDSIIRNTAAEAVLRNREDTNKICWQLEAMYNFDGAAKENYSASANIHFPFQRFGNFNVKISSVNKSPFLISEIYESNHFKWKNDFEKILTNSVSANYGLPKHHFNIGAAAYATDNYLYFDSIAFPAQATTQLKVVKYFLTKDFHHGKFHLDNFFCIQHVSDKSLIHIPQFLSRNTLYYKTGMFKGKLLTEVGFDLHYTKSYYADGFMPATTIFYWQEDVKTNGYALVDFFFNFKIKTAKIFLKLHNAGDNIIAKGYYLTPHYPQPGLLIQFGVEWRFND